MTDRFLCVFAEYDNDTEAELNRLYNRLLENGIEGSHTKGLKRHITLGYFPTDMETELNEIIKSSSEKHQVFDLDLSHLGIFDMRVLFAAPNVNYELLGLKNDICDGRVKEEREWTAHTTIVIDEENEIIEALKVIGSEFKCIKSKVTHLSLYEFFPPRLISRYALKDARIIQESE